MFQKDVFFYGLGQWSGIVGNGLFYYYFKNFDACIVMIMWIIRHFSAA